MDITATAGQWTLGSSPGLAVSKPQMAAQATQIQYSLAAACPSDTEIFSDGWPGPGY